ncbi:MAG: lipase maturation factor family protein [Thermoanaerobaculia bacterium]
MDWYFGSVWLVCLLFERGLGALYLIAFLAALFQFPPLLGERGLLPVPRFASRVRFRDTPSIFLWHYSDRFLRAVALAGVVLSIVVLSGISSLGPAWLSFVPWILLWVLYLSIVNVGQTFYAFGWETMLLEAGFFTIFMGPGWMAAPLIPVLILRWMLFRTEVGAGLIKMRGDRCWRDLTCLYYHYETQPLPNPLSRAFHHIPWPMQRFSVLFSHFVQIVVPFALFAPQPYASIAGALIVLHQLLLIVSGNYSWLNWLTVLLGVTAFSDQVFLAIFGGAIPMTQPRGLAFDVVLYVLAGVTLLLSIQPVVNIFSRYQRMNSSFNPLHLVNTYGAFGTVTKKRYEVVVEGTLDQEITERTEWREYEFKAKPGDPQRMPPQFAPWHLRLDWLMWFLPFSVTVTPGGIAVPAHEVWFVRFLRKLLEGDRAALALIRHDPFEGTPPRHVRALYYEYRFTTREEKKESGAWWIRTLLGSYVRPVTLDRIRDI